jgi:acyl carrier protein
MMTEKSAQQRETEEKIIDWVQRESKLNKDKVLSTTNLTDGAVLDSIQLISLVLYIEELRGEVIPETKISTEYFLSAEHIYNNFFAQPL